MQRYESLSRTASQAVGYCEAIAYLNDNCLLDETVEKVKIRTRRFARRQETWFRSLSECRGVMMEESLDPEATAERIAES